RALPIQAATQLDVILPIAVLVSVVLTYGRAAADNEVDTLRASGVHPLHVMTPGLLFGALASLAAAGARLRHPARRGREEAAAEGRGHQEPARRQALRGRAGGAGRAQDDLRRVL